MKFLPMAAVLALLLVVGPAAAESEFVTVLVDPQGDHGVAGVGDPADERVDIKSLEIAEKGRYLVLRYDSYGNQSQSNPISIESVLRFHLDGSTGSMKIIVTAVDHEFEVEVEISDPRGKSDLTLAPEHFQLSAGATAWNYTIALDRTKIDPNAIYWQGQEISSYQIDTQQVADDLWWSPYYDSARQEPWGQRHELQRAGGLPLAEAIQQPGQWYGYVTGESIWGVDVLAIGDDIYFSAMTDSALDWRVQRNTAVLVGHISDGELLVEEIGTHRGTDGYAYGAKTRIGVQGGQLHVLAIGDTKLTLDNSPESVLHFVKNGDSWSKQGLGNIGYFERDRGDELELFTSNDRTLALVPVQVSSESVLKLLEYDDGTWQQVETFSARHGTGVLHENSFHFAYKNTADFNNYGKLALWSETKNQEYVVSGIDAVGPWFVVANELCYSYWTEVDFVYTCGDAVKRIPVAQWTGPAELDAAWHDGKVLLAGANAWAILDGTWWWQSSNDPYSEGRVTFMESGRPVLANHDDFWQGWSIRLGLDGLRGDLTLPFFVGGATVVEPELAAVPPTADPAPAKPLPNEEMAVETDSQDSRESPLQVLPFLLIGLVVAARRR